MRFFELSIARKYLIPKKKQLSVSLIALMSVGVISLVVWLLLLFLSVTEGMEKNWLDKLTSLNAPLKITPTPAYYSSYYYLIDANASASNYTYKTIGEKLEAELADPYSPTEDWELPSTLPEADVDSNGHLRDPVKGAYSILSTLKHSRPDLSFQDFELTGALMRLEMHRPRSNKITVKGDDQGRFVTQASFLASHAEQSPSLAKLVTPPQSEDLNQLFYRANHAGNFQDKLSHLLAFVEIKTVKPSKDYWRLPFSFLSPEVSLNVTAEMDGDAPLHLILHDLSPQSQREVKGKLSFNGTDWIFQTATATYPVSNSLPLLILSTDSINVKLDTQSVKDASELSDIRFAASLKLQDHMLKGTIFWDGLEIADASPQFLFDHIPQLSPPWAYKVQLPGQELHAYLPTLDSKAEPILLPKNFQTSGCRIGDEGFFSIGGSTASSVQEQRLPFYVAGFYDPGILSIGTRCALGPINLISAMNVASNYTNVDRLTSNGIQVWFSNLQDAKDVKSELQAQLASAGIDKYWTVTTYHEFDFAKDLLQQFQSDKHLFSLIGIIILIVGCSNIISLLVLLVNDKKKEIGVMQSMGASSLSIAVIFGICGAMLGLFSSFLGTFAAMITLSHIDAVVGFLSFLQGHEAFNTIFYGESLPNALSSNATRFILIATPLISLCAGLIPAIKACRLRPSAILRGES